MKNTLGLAGGVSLSAELFVIGSVVSIAVWFVIFTFTTLPTNDLGGRCQKMFGYFAYHAMNDFMGRKSAPEQRDHRRVSFWRADYSVHQVPRIVTPQRFRCKATVR